MPESGSISAAVCRPVAGYSRQIHIGQYSRKNEIGSLDKVKIVPFYAFLDVNHSFLLTILPPLQI